MVEIIIYHRFPSIYVNPVHERECIQRWGTAGRYKGYTSAPGNNVTVGASIHLFMGSVGAGST